MIYIPNTSNNPYFNLAFEEVCLETLQTDETYFILWQNAPAVIFGKNQDLFQEVDFKYAQERGIYLVRRITGGGAVYHDLGNLNISIIGNYKLHPNYDQEYGQFITEALRNIGLRGVEMNGRNDLHVDGKKVSGWAKRIQGDSFLLHGTLLYDVDLDQLERVLQVESGKMHRKAVKSVRSVVKNIRELLPFGDINNLREALRKELQGNDGIAELNKEQLDTINQLVATKYQTEQWIYNLSFTPTLTRRFKANCGTVIVNVLLKEDESPLRAEPLTPNLQPKKLIEAITFKGDFLGNKDTDELCRLLKGVEWSAEAICLALSDIQIEAYFTGLTTDDFLVNIHPI